MSPLAKAPTKDSGMMPNRNPTVVVSWAAAVKVAIFEGSIVFGSIFAPTPGCRTLTMMRPTMRAIVVTISK